MIEWFNCFSRIVILSTIERGSAKIASVAPKDLAGGQKRLYYKESTSCFGSAQHDNYFELDFHIFS